MSEEQEEVSSFQGLDSAEIDFQLDEVASNRGTIHQTPMIDSGRHVRFQDYGVANASTRFSTDEPKVIHSLPSNLRISC